MPSPEFMARADKFQRIFSTYFPHLKEDHHQAALEMEWIWYGFMNNHIWTVRSQKAKAELDQLLRILRDLSQREVPYRQMALRRDRTNKVTEYQEDILDCLLALNEMDQEGLTEEVLDNFRERALQEIDRLPERGNVKWDAVEAVDRLRILWWRNTDSDAPSRALNPASSFYRFLADGFAFLEIDADPMSAFKRWVEAYPYKTRWVRHSE